MDGKDNGIPRRVAGNVIADLAGCDVEEFARRVGELATDLEHRLERHRGAVKLRGSLRREMIGTPERIAEATADLYDADALHRLAEAKADQARGRSWQDVMESSRRRLGQREAAALADSDRRTVEMRALGVRLRRLRDDLASVVKALQTKSWHVQMLAKMEIHGVHDVILSTDEDVDGLS